MNCPHCKVRLLMSKTITLKFTENICCVDIVWRGENQNKTNEEHPRCNQFRNSAETFCCKFSGTSVWDCTSCTGTLSKIWPSLLQNISFRQYSLHLWVRCRTHERTSGHAYSKNLEGNAFRETYLDLWHIHYFSETLPMATRNDWSTGAWPHDCRARITQSACRGCLIGARH